MFHSRFRGAGTLHSVVGILHSRLHKLINIKTRRPAFALYAANGVDHPSHTALLRMLVFYRQRNAVEKVMKLSIRYNTRHLSKNESSEQFGTESWVYFVFCLEDPIHVGVRHAKGDGVHDGGVGSLKGQAVSSLALLGHDQYAPMVGLEAKYFSVLVSGVVVSVVQSHREETGCFGLHDCMGR